jgi:hypothetical protein
LEWESIASLRADGVDDLLIRDWEAIETDIVSRPFDPDWGRLRVLEKQGYLVCLAARDSKRVITGYNVFHLGPDILSKRLTLAVNRVIWALPEWQARVGLPLILEAERGLLKLGVRRIEYNCKTHGVSDRLARLLALRGYDAIETVHAKLFD